MRPIVKQMFIEIKVFDKNYQTNLIFYVRFTPLLVNCKSKMLVRILLNYAMIAYHKIRDIHQE